MTNCVRCGRPIADTIYGAANLCPECRAAFASKGQPQPIPVQTPLAAPTRSQPYRPPVTVAIVGINVLVFAAMMLNGVSPMGPNEAQLLRWGADFGPLSLGGQLWRVFTSNYVHIGLFHIVLNMWCLWNLGRLAERILGAWTYLLTYTACGIAGSLVSLWIHPAAIGAGASGAIFGLAGALITALYLGKLPYPGQMLRGLMKSLLSFAGYNLFFGAVVPGIDNSAHIGGLLAGLAIGALLAPQLAQPPEPRRAHERLIFTAVALFLIGFGVFVKHQSGWVVEKYREQLRSAPQSEDPNP
jgi:membrane associated rhomboid family serine protease